MLGKRIVDLRHASPKHLIAPGSPAGTVVQALRHLGPARAADVADVAARRLSASDKKTLATSVFQHLRGCGRLSYPSPTLSPVLSMDKVALFDGSDRSALFGETGAARGVANPIIEKDFWVCWTLKRLFELQKEDAPTLIFKGGTSLSKAFGAIRRFSEDIDLSFDPAPNGVLNEEWGGACREFLAARTVVLVSYLVSSIPGK